METINNEVIIKRSIFKSAGYILLFLMIEVVMFLNIFYFTSDQLILKILFIIIFVFFTFILIGSIVMLIQNKPLLIINKEGFIDHSTLLSIGFISWDEIEEINVTKQYVKMKTIYFIGVRLKDIDKILIRVPKIKARLLKFNKDTINISVVQSKDKHPEVLEIMQRYFKEENINKQPI